MECVPRQSPIDPYIISLSPYSKDLTVFFIVLYVPRPSFAEEEGLLKNLMIPYGRCLEMPQHDFYAGKWKEYIELAGNMDYSNVKEISLNGDEVACKLVEEICHQLTSEKIK